MVVILYRGVGQGRIKREWHPVLSWMIKSKGLNWKHWLFWSFLIPTHLLLIVFRGGENLSACGGTLFFLTDQLQINSKKYCRIPSVTRTRITWTHRWNHFHWIFSVTFIRLSISTLDNSNFSLARAILFTLIQIYPDNSNSGCYK